MKPPFRIGHGYDLHTFIDNRPLILGGIKIPHDKGLKGHSDADCLTHAIADALLGALGLPDIGHFFPDTDPKFKDINSQILLEQILQKLHTARYTIANIDSTIIAQEPKLGPHIHAMKDALAKTLQIDTEQIGIKATTNEKIDAIGNGQAIAAHAVALITPVS